MTALIEFFGRLHPLILHAPIGLFIGVAAMELSSILRRGPRPEYAPLLLVYLTILSMLGSTASGYILSLEDGYGGKTLDLHFWAGLVSAGLSVLMVVFRQRTALAGVPQLQTGVSSDFGGVRSTMPWYANNAVLYRACVVLLAGFLALTGHLGGSMTHGEDFLFEPFRESRAARTPRAPQEQKAEEQNAVHQKPGTEDPGWTAALSVFDAKCNMCHGESKQKGGLAMHTLEALNAGGTTGSAYEPGDPENSELLIRIHLDLDHDDHMPPIDKPQLTGDEIRIITEWIASTGKGASPSASPSNGSQGASPQVTSSPVAAAQSPDGAAIAAMRAARVHIASLSPNDAQLWLDFSTVQPRLAAHTTASLLQPLLPFIVHLNLSGCELPANLGELAHGMIRLERLDLRNTSASDELAGLLASHSSLRELVLVRTQVSDASIESLSSLRGLKTLYVWNSALTPAGVVRLRAALPNARIDAGDARLSDATQTEGELKFSSDGATPQPGAPEAAPAAAPAIATLKPINDTCPVSGSPIDAKYMVVYEGKVIGFCCPNCPKQFWSDPQKFLSVLPK
jgi:YHS domain-containing protein